MISVLCGPFPESSLIPEKWALFASYPFLRFQSVVHWVAYPAAYPRNHAMEREQDKRTLKMPNKVKLTSEFVAKPPPLEPARDRTIFWATKTSCFGLQVTKSDHRSFVVQYRAGWESRRKNFKVEIGLEQARKKAMAILGDAAKGHDPLGDERAAKKLPKTTLKSVVESWLKREGGELRTVEDRRTAFEQMVYRELGSRQISEIDRDHINDLLDDIEDEHSARTATLVLAYVRKVFNWYAIRKKDFVSPIVRGMARGKTTKRKRILNDDEIRAVWTTADRLGT